MDLFCSPATRMLAKSIRFCRSQASCPGELFLAFGFFTDNRHADIEGAAIGSPIHFVCCGIDDTDPFERSSKPRAIKGDVPPAGERFCEISRKISDGAPVR